MIGYNFLFLFDGLRVTANAGEVRFGLQRNNFKAMRQKKEWLIFNLSKLKKGVSLKKATTMKPLSCVRC
jgi:hypothetical protein